MSVCLQNWIMRLWTLHPRYLDNRGLLALWREALLAQAVLAEQARGYIPATRRGYHFDATKIAAPERADLITVASGQLDYEWAHLSEKLERRAPSWLARFNHVSRPVLHPLFRIVPGDVAEWEVTQSTRKPG